MGNTAELDKDLVDGLKTAKTKRCFFVLVLKGGTDGVLLVSKTKIAAPAIAEAKKSSGGSAVVQGFVSYADGAYLFETAKECLPPPPPKPSRRSPIATRACRSTPLSAWVTNPSMKRRTTEETAHDTTTAKSEPHTEQKPKTSPLQPHPEATKFVAALQEWEQASAAALSATDQLIAALEAADDDLADAIAQVVEQLKADFPDTLDDALTGLAASANAGKTADTETFRDEIGNCHQGGARLSGQ